MAKAIALFSTLCIFAISAGFASAGESFSVKGKVYCDPCRVKFETRISERISDATVRLECKNMTTEAVTYSVEGKTALNGSYSLTVEGDHSDEICDVTVEKSPREDCKDTVPGLEKSEVVCSNNVGMHSNVRYANPLFFMKEKVSKDCAQVLKELGYIPIDMY